jgi:hypothetical protein
MMTSLLDRTAAASYNSSTNFQARLLAAKEKIMGASGISIVFDGKKTKKEIQEAFRCMSDEAAYSHGHEYSGSWNMLHGVSFPTEKVFESSRTADTWVMDNAEKWGNAVCVRFKDVKKVFISPPTFGGKLMTDHRRQEIINVEIDWKTSVGYRQLERIKTMQPADQLTAAEAAEAIKLYTASRDLGHRYDAMSHRWAECGYASATQEQICGAFQTYKNAKDAYGAFTKPIIERLWATKDEPYEGWFMGGWAAE